MFYFPSRGVYKTRVDDTRAAYETQRYMKEEHHPVFLVSTAELEQLSLLCMENLYVIYNLNP